ncbi:MAG: DegT/DnrJ/EryC1/StrS family aminotransferase [Roseitalea porphyridii]|jgi:dTDP-4-amino-4,6-dideoxygalactose transaminase|uniref:DegT/DnrJ/EryC1/StrS family aminotransferase n=2 Tax=Roseitalea porphyridii TaxID=1852022 RepID=UPI0032EE0C29
MPDIPFFNYPAIYKRYEAEFDAIFKDVCSRGAYILQRDLEEFETDLARFLNVRHALGVADGTNAMVIGLKAHDIGPGDEVIIASHTYIATAAAVHMVGATPVFADIGEDYMMSAADATKRVTPKTRAIMPTQLNGRCCNMDEIQALADAHGLLVFEDSAQGLGARFKGRCAGTFGRFGTLSFYPAKLLGCFGDGGAVMTNDDAVAENLKLWRDHGRNDDGEVVAWGTNSRLDNLQAAFLKFRLGNYEKDMARRRQIAGMYEAAFRGHDKLHPPQGPSDGDHYDVYQNYEMAAEDRDGLRAALSDKGIRTIIQWAGTPVHWFDNLGYGRDKVTDLPKTDWFFDRCLMLPMHMALTDDDVNAVIDAVLGYYK